MREGIGWIRVGGGQDNSMPYRVGGGQANSLPYRVGGGQANSMPHRFGGGQANSMPYMSSQEAVQPQGEVQGKAVAAGTALGE